jgi:hypothetical protein
MLRGSAREAAAECPGMFLLICLGVAVVAQVTSSKLVERIGPFYLTTSLSRRCRDAIAARRRVAYAEIIAA